MKIPNKPPLRKLNALIAATILGCLYCPMAILAVAMKDSVLAGNPLVVFPAILRMPLEYALTAFVLLCAYGLYQLGNWISMVKSRVSKSTASSKRKTKIAVLPSPHSLA